jgi:hypothetical protein
MAPTCFNSSFMHVTSHMSHAVSDPFSGVSIPNRISQYLPKLAEERLAVKI